MATAMAERAPLGVSAAPRQGLLWRRVEPIYKALGGRHSAHCGPAPGAETSVSSSEQPFSSSVASFFLSFLFSPLFLLCAPLDKISRTINDVEINKSLPHSAQHLTLAPGLVPLSPQAWRPLGKAPSISTSLK